MDPRSDGSAARLAQISDAKQQFVDAAINMGWQLAITILVPVFIGVQLDKHFNSSPSYTLAALFLAVFMSCTVVWKTIKGVSRPQAAAPKNRKNT